MEPRKATCVLKKNTGGTQIGRHAFFDMNTDALKAFTKQYKQPTSRTAILRVK